MTIPSLMITTEDARRLRLLFAGSDVLNLNDRQQREELQEEIERARIVPSDQIPRDVVTMHSQVRIVDMRTGEQLVYQIVYPHEANYAERRISVLAPIGMALLGYPVGTEIDWKVPSGTRRLRIEAVKQPRRTARAIAA